MDTKIMEKAYDKVMPLSSVLFSHLKHAIMDEKVDAHDCILSLSTTMIHLAKSMYKEDEEELYIKDLSNMTQFSRNILYREVSDEFSKLNPREIALMLSLLADSILYNYYEQTLASE